MLLRLQPDHRHVREKLLGPALSYMTRTAQKEYTELAVMDQTSTGIRDIMAARLYQRLITMFARASGVETWLMAAWFVVCFQDLHSYCVWYGSPS